MATQGLKLDQENNALKGLKEEALAAQVTQVRERKAREKELYAIRRYDEQLRKHCLKNKVQLGPAIMDMKPFTGEDTAAGRGEGVVGSWNTCHRCVDLIHTYFQTLFIYLNQVHTQTSSTVSEIKIYQTTETVSKMDDRTRVIVLKRVATCVCSNRCISIFPPFFPNPKRQNCLCIANHENRPQAKLLQG